MKYYTTRSGDTLPRLAALFYFRHDLYDFLYLHNRDVIGADMFVLPTNTKLAIPEPLLADVPHSAIEGETSSSLSEKYYGIREYYHRIDGANDWPASIVAGTVYRVPALLSQLELDAAAQTRRNFSVEFDR